MVPTVVIDNDERKKGKAEFGVPVMPFAQAREQYPELQYFICSDDYKYSIIGDMLEKGIQPESIINYVPVEKRRACLYFYNRFLLTLGVDGKGTQIVGHCNKDSFKKETMSTRIPCVNGNYDGMREILDRVYADFENGEIDVCRNCVMNQEQYIVSKRYKKHYKQVACYQGTCGDCLSSCIYCCVGGNTKDKSGIRLNSLESYSSFLEQAFSLGRIDDDFSCAIDMSERDSDKKIGIVVDQMERAGLKPMTYKINSCLLAYSSRLAELLKKGSAYVVWSLDAGTKETYRKVKQIDAFDHVLENVRRLIKEDAFGGRFIVAKYLIVRDINDNGQEFDAFLRVVGELGLKFVSLGFDFNAAANEKDLQFIRECYGKLVRKGLQLTYKNDSEPVTRALHMNNLKQQ